MRKKIIILAILSLMCIIYFSGIVDDTATISVPDDCSIYFTDSRPDKDNEDIVLCVPAAYTSEDGNIIGHYSTGGKRNGITDYGYTTIHLDHGTYFQQASLVRNHQPKYFTDSKRRFRRALCKSGGRYTIVHSSQPMTLTAFARTLSSYEKAWNLDMGTYAYGWYRDESSIHHLGFSAIWNKQKQTNWIVMRKN